MNNLAVWLIVIFLILLISGFPIGFSLATTALIIIYVYDLTSLTTLSQIMYSALNSFTLIAIPFFVMVGAFLSGGKVVDYIFKFANCIFGKISGGLGMGTILASAILAAVSGSSMANAAALSMAILPALVKYNYRHGEAGALIATGGTLGILIPPSLTMILYGVITNQSIGHLFMAGLVPGLVLVTLLLITVWLLSLKKGKTDFVSSANVWQAFKNAFPIMIAPILILGGIYSGFFTPEESAAVAIIYSILITVFWYKTLTFKDVGKIFVEGGSVSSVLMFLVAGAMVFGYVATVSQIPQKLSLIITESGLPLFAVLILVNIFLLIMGCFLDVFSIMLITVPVLYPILTKMGIDPLQLAVIYTINMEIGTITPPVGMNLYAISGTTGVMVEEIVRYSVPYYLVLILGLILVCTLPFLSTWLPSLM